MKIYFKTLTLCVLCTGLFSSCMKDQLLDKKTYYGKVGINIINFPNTPDVDVYFNDQKLGLLKSPGNDTSAQNAFLIQTGKGKLSVYETGSKKLIADTLIEISPKKATLLKLANSKDYGFIGWVKTPETKENFLKVQFIFKIGRVFNPSNMDVYFFTAKGRPLIFKETDFRLAGVKANEGLDSRIITLPCSDDEDRFLNYYLRFKDTKTGEFIAQPRVIPVLQNSYQLFNTSGLLPQGQYILFIVDDIDGDTESTNLIQLKPIDFDH